MIEDSICIALVALAFLIGIEIGHLLTDISWKVNSNVPARILKHGKFYKVIKIKSKHSWEMADIHRTDIEEE